MKKIATLLLALFTFSGISIAQNAATPNAGFENWTNTPGSVPYDDPNNWNSLNATTAPLPFVGDVTCYKATAIGEFHLGAAAVKLITKNIAGNMVNGIVTTGTINTSAQTITGGIAFTSRPDSIVGWYISTIVGADSGFVQFLLTGTGGDTDTVGHAIFRAPSVSVSTFTRFAVAINYHNTNAPVTSQWLLSSSGGANGQVVNTTIWVDDLDLITNPTLRNANEIKTGISLGPNPANNSFRVFNSSTEFIPFF